LLVERAEALLVTILEEPQPPAGQDTADRTPVPRDTQPMLFFTTAFVLRAQFYKRPDFSLSETLERFTDDFIPLSNVQVFPLAGGQPVTRPFACLSRSRISALCVVPGAAHQPPAVSPTPLPPAPPPPEPMLPNEQ